jgi:hypothetical protein
MQRSTKETKINTRKKNNVNRDCPKERYPARKQYACQNKKIGIYY